MPACPSSPIYIRGCCFIFTHPPEVRGQCELPSNVVLVGDIRIHPTETKRGKRSGQRETPDPPVWSLPAHFSRDGTVVVPRPTILGPCSAVCGQCQFTPSVALVGDIRIHPVERQRERPRGHNDTPVASQVINHRTISREPVGPQLPKTDTRKLEQQFCSH